MFQYFIPLLDHVKPKAGETVYDLGCGAGKPLLIASLTYPDLKVCRGIEYMEGLADLGKDVATKAQ